MTLLYSLIGIEKSLHCEHFHSKNNFEPLNVFSNFAFFLVAYASFRLLKRTGLYKRDLKPLPLLIVLIGVGSLFYHLIPTVISAGSDVGFIFVFIIYCSYLILRRITRNIAIHLLAGLLLVFIFLNSFIVSVIAGIVIRVALYFITGLLLVFLIYKQKSIIAYRLIAAVILFCIGGVMLGLDLILCSYVSIGLHFLWHILSALAAYFIVWFFVGFENIKQREH